MGYTFINVTKLEASSGSSFNGTVASTAGNALFACAGTTSLSTTPTVSGGGTWAKDTSGNNSTLCAASISSCPSATGGSQTVTTSNTAGGVTIVYEFSGNPSSGILDAASPAAATGTSATATTGNDTNVTAAAVFIAMMVYNTSGNPATVTGTTGTFTYPAGGLETNGSSFDALGSGYRIVSSVTANANSAWTIDSAGWVALIAVYAAAAGGSTFPLRWVMHG